MDPFMLRLPTGPIHCVKFATFLLSFTYFHGRKAIFRGARNSTRENWGEIRLSYSTNTHRVCRFLESWLHIWARIQMHQNIQDFRTFRFKAFCNVIRNNMPGHNSDVWIHHDMQIHLQA